MKNRITVRMKPQITVPQIESKGFFINLLHGRVKGLAAKRAPERSQAPSNLRSARFTQPMAV
jgi:hypothetical protein